MRRVSVYSYLNVLGLEIELGYPEVVDLLIELEVESLTRAEYWVESCRSPGGVDGQGYKVLATDLAKCDADSYSPT